MTDPLLVTHDDSGVVTLTLNAPETSNALSEHMLVALRDTFDDLALQPDLVSVVLSAAGADFCVGHDLSEIRLAQDGALEAQRAYFRDLFDRTAALMLQIAEFPKPVLALTQGRVAAAGLQLVACADIALASTSARFRVDDPQTGFFGAGPAVALSRALPSKIVSEMVLAGRELTALEALRFGLVNRVVPPERLLADGITRATELREPNCALGLSTLSVLPQLPLRDAYDRAARGMAETLSSDDARRNVEAALARRA